MDKLTKKDFETPQDVRWCPGCGDYAILAAIQKLLPDLGIEKEKFVFVSGIGCSSRFPYYMNTYGFHTIHGRAPAVATGVKLSNSDLSVWLITGDGDALSIGGNHLIHLCRRNVNINVLLFNNRIYGLTKGQYSPTSEIGKVTKSTPYGSYDHPVNPLSLVLGADASFVARTIDNDAKHMIEVFKEAQNHQGTSFVEIYQNCVIFNDNAFSYMSDRSLKADKQLNLKNGEPLIFGSDVKKAIALKGLSAEVVELESKDEESLKKEIVEKGIMIHDANSIEQANILSRLDASIFPTPLGVIYKKERITFEEQAQNQRKHVKSKSTLSGNVDKDLSNLFNSGNTWTV